MRNFTFLISATLTASMACAATMAKGELQSSGSPAPKVIVSGLHGTSSSVKAPVHDKQSAAMKMARSRHKVALRSTAPITSEVIEDFPEGSVSQWSRSSEAAELFWGYPYEYTDRGLAVDMVEDSDGKIWMNSPFSQYPVPGKYYAVKNGDMLTIPGGQCVIEAFDWDEEEYVNYYLIAMELGDDGEYHAADNLDYNLVNDNGSWKSQNPDLAIGLASYDEESQSYFWVGESEFNLVYAPQIHKTLEVPADLSVEKWAYVDEETSDGYFVNVGVKDNVIYLQGLYKNIPEAWLKLSLDGQTATFTGQYMGNDIENYHYTYLMPGRVEEEWDEEWEDYVNVLYATEKIEFTYDADNKVLATESAVIFSTVADAVFTVAEDPYLFQPRIAMQNRVAGTPPANPTDIYLSPYDEMWGYGSFDFAIPATDTDGNLIDSDKLYYRIYVDGELFEFYDDEYYGIPESPMVNVPWSLCDNDSFFKVGMYHSIWYYFTGFESMGVQSVYLEENESGQTSELCSDIISATLSGIGNVETDSLAISSTQYFDMQGRLVANPKTGIYIRRVTYSDGSVDNRKVLKK